MYSDGLEDLQWGVLPDSLEEDLIDYRAVDSTIKILEAISDGSLALCDSAFFWHWVLICPMSIYLFRKIFS